MSDGKWELTGPVSGDVYLSRPRGAAMAHFATPRLQFGLVAGLPLNAAFDAGRLTSDGGLLWLGEADESLGICEALAACVPDWRRGPVWHSLPTLVRQRIFPIACGYADQNDATTLRSDPLLKSACPLGHAQDRVQGELSGLKNCGSAGAQSGERHSRTITWKHTAKRGTPERDSYLDARAAQNCGSSYLHAGYLRDDETSCPSAERKTAGLHDWSRSQH
jgi:Transposase DDE domain group 1